MKDLQFFGVRHNKCIDTPRWIRSYVIDRAIRSIGASPSAGMLTLLHQTYKIPCKRPMYPRAHRALQNEIFRQVGECLAITWLETQRILRPAAHSRILFGRLVKRPECFRLMLEGARRRLPDIDMDVADSEMANTPLMRQLDADPHFTVAQFAQAVGAIYYANRGLQAKE